MKLRAVRAILGFSFIALNLAAQKYPSDKPAPAGPKAATPATPASKDEAPKIEGQEIKRGDRYLGIAVVGGNFKLTFYDSKKKPMAPEVARAALRWRASYQPADERAVLTPAGDGKSLSSAKVVKPPLSFKLYIVLIPAEGSEESASESYQIDFRG